MKTEIRMPWYIGLLLVFHEALAAQPFFYHAGQDKNAQLAASTAKEIANGAFLTTRFSILPRCRRSKSSAS